MRVLLLTDGSTDAKAATEWLRQFPLPRGSTLTVMSVACMRRAPVGVPAVTVREFLDGARAHARGVAEEARDRLRTRWPEARVHVAAGDSVASGQPIGSVGETGSASGPGLYFEIRHDGKAVDPTLWLAK